MRDYGKVFSRIWESEDFRSMSEDGRTLVLYLLTCQHGTLSGVFRVPDGYACEDLQWPSERVCSAFAETLRKGFANRCETTKWVWIVKFLEWNPPENPNQRKAAAKQGLSVPDTCGWKPEFMRVCGPSIGVEPPSTGNPSQTLGEPSLNQYQEQKQKQEQEQEEEKPPASSSADKLPTCPVEQIVGLYRQILPELPDVRVMDDKRRDGIRTMWRWVLTSKKPDGARRAESRDDALAWFRSYFEMARENDFLMGRTRRGDAHSNWKCDIDFLVTMRGIKQVIERTEAA